jgi:hypothetical protein
MIDFADPQTCRHTLIPLETAHCFVMTDDGGEKQIGVNAGEFPARNANFERVTKLICQHCTLVVCLEYLPIKVPAPADGSPRAVIETIVRTGMMLPQVLP